MDSRLLDRTIELGLAGDHGEAEKMYTERHPIGRLGEPTDVANALVFACQMSPASVPEASL